MAACTGRSKMYTNIWSETLKHRERLENIRVDGDTFLKVILTVSKKGDMLCTGFIL